jgi:hypothetical protein
MAEFAQPTNCSLIIMKVALFRIQYIATSNKYFFFISRKFTIYSTNGAISKYVVRKHLCGAIIQ